LDHLDHPCNVQRSPLVISVHDGSSVQCDADVMPAIVDSGDVHICNVLQQENVGIGDVTCDSHENSLHLIRKKARLNYVAAAECCLPCRILDISGSVYKKIPTRMFV